MQPFIRLMQRLPRRFEEGLVLEFLTGTQGCQAVEANIDADCSVTFCWAFIGHFHCNTDEPPIGGSGDACSCDFPHKAQLLRHVDPAEFGNPHPVIA